MKVVVIGGGPAGIMSAISAKNSGNDVILIEKMNSLGKKLLITGKGRCNITNASDISEFFVNINSNSDFLYSALYSFSSKFSFWRSLISLSCSKWFANFWDTLMYVFIYDSFKFPNTLKCFARNSSNSKR